MELGLSGYSEILRHYNYNERYFRVLLKGPFNVKQLREQVVIDCGLSEGNILAICDKLKE
jgi:hypothetical protein